MYCDKDDEGAVPFIERGVDHRTNVTIFNHF